MQRLHSVERSVAGDVSIRAHTCIAPSRGFSIRTPSSSPCISAENKDYPAPQRPRGETAWKHFRARWGASNPLHLCPLSTLPSPHRPVPIKSTSTMPRPAAVALAVVLAAALPHVHAPSPSHRAGPSRKRIICASPLTMVASQPSLGRTVVHTVACSGQGGFVG